MCNSRKDLPTHSTAYIVPDYFLKVTLLLSDTGFCLGPKPDLLIHMTLTVSINFDVISLKCYGDNLHATSNLQ